MKRGRRNLRPNNHTQIQNVQDNLPHHNSTGAILGWALFGYVPLIL